MALLTMVQINVMAALQGMLASSGGSSANAVYTMITELFTQVLVWFRSVFTLITSSEVMPWVLIGVGISLLGVFAKFVKKLLWGV